MSMYQGSNPTALQSQNMIIKALISLMHEVPFSRITIKSICERAMVSRQTFYTLFEGKEEVIGLHLDRLFQDYRDRFLREKQTCTIRSLCNSIVACLVEQKEMIKLIVDNRLDTIAKEKTESYLAQLDSLFHTTEREDKDYAIAFMAGALMNVTVLAVRRNDFGDGQKISKLIEQIITGNYFIL
ncbi:MAG: TetR/AcrR family transcriptional regulator [Hominenteromicrobium sp.]